MAQAYIFYGGSFSPPTIAHIMALKQVAEVVYEKHPEIVITGVFVPVSSNYNKKSVRLPDSDKHRLQMLNLAVEWLQGHETIPNIKYEVSDHEIKIGTSVPTIDSLNILKDKFGHEHIYYLLIGEDNVRQILEKKWKQSNDLLKNPILLLQRPGYDSNFSKYPTIFPVELDGINTNISSTKLRAAIRNGSNSLSQLTIPSIIEYIRTRGLYLNNVGGRRRRTKKRKTYCVA